MVLIIHEVTVCKVKYVCCFLFLILNCIFSKTVLSNDSLLKEAFENIDPVVLEYEVERQQYRAYKDEQNKLPDNKRDKYLLQNEYWLVNKYEKLWFGLFNGKYSYFALGKYRPSLPIGRYAQEKILRIKKDEKTIQFRLYSDDDVYPLDCDSYRGFIYKDTTNYTAFFTSCGYKENNRDDAKTAMHVYVFIYDKRTTSLFKIYSSIMSVNRSYSELANLFNIIENNGIYIYPDPAYYVNRKCVFEVKDNKKVFSLNPKTLKPWGNKLVEKAKLCRLQCQDDPDDCPDDCSLNYCSPLSVPVVVEKFSASLTQ